MHRTARTVLVTAAAASVLLSSGCTTLVPGLPAPTGVAPPSAAGAVVETDGVAWMDKICGAMLPVLDLKTNQPSLTAGNPATAVTALGNYLDTMGTSVDGSIKAVAAAGPSPIEGGDKAAAAMTKTLTAVRDSARAAKTKIDAIDTSDPKALATQLPAAIEPLTSLSNLPNPAAELETNPELEKAAAQAPNCQKVQATVN
jgi:hypothetical protein